MPKDRPKCVECGSSHIISRGSSWECKECGRRFQKRYRGEFGERQFNKRVKEIRELANEQAKRNKCSAILIAHQSWFRREIMEKYNLSERTAIKLLKRVFGSE